MPTVALYNMQGEQVGEISLADRIFGIEVNKAAMHQAVLAYQANQRQGNAAVKTRTDVSGGGRKPWRQKGTGRARHGSTRSPLWKGGGVIFGPSPRSFRMAVPKKIKRLAIKSALSSKVNAGSLVVLDKLTIEAPKTKEMVKVLNNLNTGRNVLIVTDTPQEYVVKSVRNIPGVKALNACELNVYDILNTDNVIITRDAVAQVEEVFLNA